MIDRRTLKKIIKEYLTPFVKKNNFKFTRPTILTRENEDVLHIINFDLPSQGFNCNIAIQPLYFPSDDINLSFGNRLNNFKTQLPGVWGYGKTKQEIENDLNVVIDLLETNALPWFDNVGNPRGIVSFIQDDFNNNTNSLIWCPPFLKNIYLGFSYLYLKEYELANNPLKAAIEFFKDDSRDWTMKLKELVHEVGLMSKNDPDKVSNKLEEFIQKTKSNFKLK